MKFIFLFFFCLSFLFSREFYKGKEFEKIGDFRNGFAPVAEKGFWGKEKWGFIDTRGDIVIPLIYEDAWYFNEYGLGIVSKGLYSKDKKKLYGFVRKSDGFYFDQVRDFQKNVASVRRNGFWGSKKWGFINRKLDIIVPIIYDNIEPFKNHYAKGRIGSRTVYFNKKAEVFYFFAKCKKKEFKNFVILKKNNLYGVITPKQQIIKEVKYDLMLINAIYY